MRLLPKDTIAWRFGVAIASAMAAGCTMIGLFFAFGGVWAQPPIDVAARIDGAMSVVQMLDALPPSMRPDIARMAATKTYSVDWHPPSSAVATWLDSVDDDPDVMDHIQEFKAFTDRPVIVVTPDDKIAASSDFPLRSNWHPETRLFAVKLGDGSWVAFAGQGRYWGLSQVERLTIWILLLLLSLAIVSAITVRRLSRPIRRFAKAVRRSGTSGQSPPIAEEGPQELQDLIAAFNDMRAQIRDFVAYRTAMLASISHDLRTPLTRIRLRGEYIADETQQMRLFRDVDDMQAMVDGALAFFRGDGDDEAIRTFDLPGILQSIADDYADQGVEVAYTGPDRLSHVGRPLALKRAFTNLVENAVKYGSPPSITLSCRDEEISVTIQDHGPGIPAEALERVFAPFYRLDKSRNRAVGGFGLGLTAAQAIMRGHRGDITLRNSPDGGLEATVTLPRTA